MEKSKGTIDAKLKMEQRIAVPVALLTTKASTAAIAETKNIPPKAMRKD